MVGRVTPMYVGKCYERRKLEKRVCAVNVCKKDFVCFFVVFFWVSSFFRVSSTYVGNLVFHATMAFSWFS